MGTSFVEYRGFGFWSRDSYLGCWLKALIAEIQRQPSIEPWQRDLMEYWSIQAETNGGTMSLGLDQFVIDKARKRFILSISKKALRQVDLSAHRTGELFIGLVSGRLKTTDSSRIDYL